MCIFQEQVVQGTACSQEKLYILEEIMTKVLKRAVLGGGILVGMVVLWGCASTGGVESGKPAPSSGYSILGKETTVVDWDGRTLGAEATPEWLASANRGDFSAFIQIHKNTGQVKKEHSVFKRSTGTGADLRAATMRADMAYARNVARELQQSVNVFAAEQARAGNIDDTTRQAIEEVTQTQSNAEITGHAKVVDYWQQVIEVDPLTGNKSSRYIVYQIYEIEPDTWTKTTAKYVKEVLGGVPDELTPEQDFVKDLVGQMMDDARFPTVLSQQEALQKAEAAKRMADVQAELAPAQQKAAAEQELAKIMQEGKTERTQIVADARTEQVQAQADATKTAYLSGNPVYTSAATVTAADQEWVEAEALAAAILFG